MKPLLPLALLAVALGGCAAHGYPSLLPRAGEQLDFREPPAPLPTPVTPDPALDSRIGAARETLRQAGAAFDAAAARAERLADAARGAAAGSDAWLDAQTALADLDGEHARQSDVQADLEALAVERAVALSPAYPALDRAVEEAGRAADASGARIAAIQRKLAPAN